jgi:magnesium transporter
MQFEHDTIHNTDDIEKIEEIIHQEKWEQLKPLLAELHPADIADIIDNAPSNSREEIFSILNDDIKSDVLAELQDSSGSDVAEALTDSELSNIVSDMAPDDAADVLGDLPDERSEHVLNLMEDEESEDVRKLLKYDEDTAGGIMTTDVVAMHANQTVAEAIETIAYLDTEENFQYANIIDEQGKMIGYVNIWELLREKDRQKPLTNLIHHKFCYATDDMDQEDVAQLAQQYNLNVIPVLDSNGILVGRVTTDDIIDVIEEEASEDILRLAGSDDEELEDISIIKSSSIRLPWLFITLIGGFITSIILRVFHAHLADVLILAAFVPVVLAMGGNTGIQASTLAVRSIALGVSGERNISKLLLREITTGALMGIICGLVIGLWVLAVVLTGGEHHLSITPIYLSITVGTALFLAMTFAAVFGAFIPMLLNKMGIDPAVASGPFISILNDISALLIYFGVTMLLLNIIS